MANLIKSPMLRFQEGFRISALRSDWLTIEQKLKPIKVNDFIIKAASLACLKVPEQIQHGWEIQLDNIMLLICLLL